MLLIDLLSETCLESYIAVVRKHLAAYTIDPKYRGEKLTAEQQETANQWFVSRDPTFHLLKQ